MLTPEEIADRARRAVAAAAAAGRDLGLDVTAPRVLYDAFSVVVHLAPAPVVARVPTVLSRTIAADPKAQATQQRRELAVAGQLAAQGHPVVPPSPLVPPEPVRRDGYSITLWTFVEQIEGSAHEDLSRAHLAARLHAALRAYPGELGWFVPLDESIPDALEVLRDRPDLLAPADLDRARRAWELIGPLTSSPEAFAATFPEATVQPIHGDAPLYNVIPTPDGEFSAYFEHVTIGPVEWDLTFASPEQLAAYDEAASGLGLRPHDPRLLDVMAAARMMQLVACLPMIPELPVLAEGLRPAIDHWRTQPLAGGLAGQAPARTAR